MATRSDDTLGSGAKSPFKGGSNPTVLSLSSLKKCPKPDPSWTNPREIQCRCGSAVWIHEATQRAMSEINVIALCPDCAEQEKERQSGF